MRAAAHARYAGLAQGDGVAGVALGVGVGIWAWALAGLHLERVQRHARDDAALEAGDVVGDDRVAVERERDGAPAQLDDLDGLHHWYVSMARARRGSARVSCRTRAAEL